MSYLLMAGAMVAAYVGGVLGLGPVLRPLAGSNDLAEAGSTLAAAALFSPACRWIQPAVDRRFSRRRLDRWTHSRHGCESWEIKKTLPGDLA